ncbi:hypothetical protein SLS56_007134 [Neofusicoccum ribis]|uniref:Uncharacterized protein n=1 Tax=Neofusicoccum ribis TaxID=45134 RepID=A0ABR3SPB2_9PEZI
MKKTLLLCFIHGFKVTSARATIRETRRLTRFTKGDDDTFRKFPQHLRGVLENQLPKLTVLAVTYPHYETRGDLLQNKIIDLEVANGTPSPTVDPSVRVVLCGHSMGESLNEIPPCEPY